MVPSPVFETSTTVPIVTQTDLPIAVPIVTQFELLHDLPTTLPLPSIDPTFQPISRRTRSATIEENKQIELEYKEIAQKHAEHEIYTDNIIPTTETQVTLAVRRKHTEDKPTSEQAIISPRVKEWWKAMKLEFGNLERRTNVENMTV